MKLSLGNKEKRIFDIPAKTSCRTCDGKDIYIPIFVIIGGYASPPPKKKRTPY